MSPLRWTYKSVGRLKSELATLGRRTCDTVVEELLMQHERTQHGNRKTHEGNTHPDWNTQVVHISQSVSVALVATSQVIAVDTTKTALVGAFKAGGREWRPQGKAADVRVYDFLVKEPDETIPCHASDLTANVDWVSVQSYRISSRSERISRQSGQPYWFRKRYKYPRFEIADRFVTIAHMRLPWVSASMDQDTALRCRQSAADCLRSTGTTLPAPLAC